MKEKVDTIIDFTNSLSFEIKEEIISTIRKQMCEPIPYDVFMEDLKEQMIKLDFIESYSREDEVWNWSESYYGFEDEENDEYI